MLSELVGAAWNWATARPERQRYRVYYNRSEDAPQVWSIDMGSTGSEVNVQWVQVRAQSITRYNAKAKYPEPRAWLDVYSARLHLFGGGAVLE